MPDLLDGSDYDCSQRMILTSPDDPDHNCSQSGKDNSASIPECDYSKTINDDEVSLFNTILNNIELQSDEEEEPVNVTDCGKCDYIKEENRYSQAYFEKEYGKVYCCNKDCKNPNKTMREFIDTRSDKCFWVCKNCKRRNNDTHGCTKMYCNTCFFSKEESMQSGMNKRARRTRSL